MLRYLGRRLAYALALLLAVVTLNFLLIHISPGDPVETIAGSMGGISENCAPSCARNTGWTSPSSRSWGCTWGRCCAATWAIPISSTCR